MGFATTRAVPAAATLLIVTAACSGREDAAEDRRTGEPVVAEADPGHRLVVADQRTDGDDVLVDEVVLAEGGGYVAIYRDAEGTPGEQLGVSTLLSTGTHTALEVPLTEPLTERTAAFAVLHGEEDGDDVLDWPGPDAPLTAGGGDVVAVPVALDLDR